MKLTRRLLGGSNFLVGNWFFRRLFICLCQMRRSDHYAATLLPDPSIFLRPNPKGCMQDATERDAPPGRLYAFRI